MDKLKLAYVDNGTDGQPGGEYDKQVARVDRIRLGRYQLSVFFIWGNNQGYEEHGRIERRYRAGTIDDLMRIGLAEVAADAELGRRAAVPASHANDSHHRTILRTVACARL